MLVFTPKQALLHRGLQVNLSCLELEDSRRYFGVRWRLGSDARDGPELFPSVRVDLVNSSSSLLW